jgi:uncharacterized protein YbaR (Trm112 family)
MVIDIDSANGSESEDRAPDIDPALLSLLVCPLTKHRLDYDRDNGELVSKAARLAYPIRGGIPIMLPSEARALDDL